MSVLLRLLLLFLQDADRYHSDHKSTSSTVSSLSATRSHTKEASACKFCSQKRAVMIRGTKTPASNNKNICKKNSLTNFVMLVAANFAWWKMNMQRNKLCQQLAPQVGEKWVTITRHKDTYNLNENICNRNNMTVVTRQRLLFCGPALIDSLLLINRGKRKQAPTNFYKMLRKITQPKHALAFSEWYHSLSLRYPPTV